VKVSTIKNYLFLLNIWECTVYYEVEVSRQYGYFVPVGYYEMGIWTLYSWVKVSRTTCSCWMSGSEYYEVDISRQYGYYVPVGYYVMGIWTLESWVKVSRTTCSCWISGSVYYEVEISRLYGYLCLWDMKVSRTIKCETTCSCWIWPPWSLLLTTGGPEGSPCSWDPLFSSPLALHCYSRTFCTWELVPSIFVQHFKAKWYYSFKLNK